MPNAKKKPRLLRWKGKWHLFFTDPTTGKQRRLNCAAAGANTSEQRLALLAKHTIEQKEAALDVLKAGGAVAYNLQLLAGLAKFRADVEERVAARLANPGARAGIAPRSAVELLRAVEALESWIRRTGLERITTGAFSGAQLERFFTSLATEPGHRGKGTVTRTGATINAYKRHVKVALRWLASLRPAPFPDPNCFARALKPLRTDTARALAYSPQELQRFFEVALEREDPDRRVQVLRWRRSNLEAFRQTAPAIPATPYSRLFLLCALLGIRLGEALRLRWDDLDLDRGRLTVKSTKTGRSRVLQLSGAPEAELCPGLLQLLCRWREEDPGAEFILPHRGLEAPAFCKHGWSALAEAAGSTIAPQRLRQNFCSYCASVGVPPAVSALWQGHGAAVAERHYRQQVLDRASGASLEAAMGLDGPIAELLAAEPTGLRIVGGRRKAR